MSQQVAKNTVSYRLALAPVVAEKFGISGSQWKVLTEVVFPLAQSADSILLALSYCKARNLDIMKKPCHIVPMWSTKENRYVDTIWPGVSELRTTATRTGAYAGADATVFGEEKERTFKGQSQPRGNKPAKSYEATISYPTWAQVTVYRMVQGQRVPFPGPRVIFLETYSKISPKIGVPNDKWQRSPSYMLEKCAEAAALRKAFPEEIGEDHAWEEMEGKDLPEDPPPPDPKPARDDFAAADKGEAREEPQVERSGTIDRGGAKKSEPRAPAPEPEKPVEEVAIDDQGWPEDEEPPAVLEPVENAAPSPFEVMQGDLKSVREALQKLDFPGDLAKLKDETKSKIMASKGVLSEDEISALLGQLSSIFLERQRELRK